jgi:hypothetical protein
MREKCAQLGERARHVLEGANSRDSFVGKFTRASTLLGEARSKLLTAIDVIHGIDVTVEVPDEEETRP